MIMPTESVKDGWKKNISNDTNNPHGMEMLNNLNFLFSL